MGTRNYITLSEDLSLSDRQKYRLGAMAAGVVACFDNNIGSWNPNEIPAKNGVRPTTGEVMAFLISTGGEPPASIDIREFEPILDAGAALDQWNTAALAAAGTEYSCFQAVAVPAIGLRAKKLVVWYRVQVETVPLPVSRLIFRRNAANGIRTAAFDLEQLATGEKVDGYLSSPQIWLPNMPHAINVMARNVVGAPTGLLANVILGNFVFEPAGGVSA
ncbi:MAG: hypothetical protein KAR06_02645 [Deltaproteobacteria bacterium]|nr:hypothetical protein [Deltaproteobacteria bacterium]